MQPKIIGISAIAGGGKSTLVRQLVDQIDGAIAIHFDDYATDETYPQDFSQWLADGADFNQFRTPNLADDLAKLKRGETIVSPVDGSTVAATDYIFFEAPLGRAHHATGQHIDYLVFIDTPLEVGLARFVLRSLESAENAAPMPLKTYIEAYLFLLRRVYLAQREQIIPASDLVLKGEQSVDVWVQTVYAMLESQS